MSITEKNITESGQCNQDRERRLAMIPGLEEEVSMADSGHRSLLPVFVSVVELLVAAGVFLAPPEK